MRGDEPSFEAAVDSGADAGGAIGETGDGNIGGRAGGVREISAVEREDEVGYQAVEEEGDEGGEED